MKTTQDLFMKMISLEHLFQCWNDFKRGKHKRKDIQYFERDLEDNIFLLHEELKTQQYEHLTYEHFRVTDPKQRFISKAIVRDRLVHHMVFNELTAIFDNQFIHLSLSCRKGKGIHFGILHLQRMIKMISYNGTKPCYALKMDIKRFFDTIDHKILKTLIRKRVYDDAEIRTPPEQDHYQKVKSRDRFYRLCSFLKSYIAAGSYQTKDEETVTKNT